MMGLPVVVVVEPAVEVTVADKHWDRSSRRLLVDPSRPRIGRLRRSGLRTCRRRWRRPGMEPPRRTVSHCSRRKSNIVDLCCSRPFLITSLVKYW